MNTSKEPKIIVFSGAGLSAESGLDTFRGDNGIWKRYDVQKVCNFSYFLNQKEDSKERERIFDFYIHLQNEVNKSEPNYAHKKIAEWQKKYGKEKVIAITTNVDDLLSRAGVEDVLHVHGDLQHMSCASCGYIWSSEFDYALRCPHCESRQTKPGVVFFGEQARNYNMMNHILNIKNRHQKDLIIVIGSSLQVVGVDMILQHQKINHNINKAKGLSVILNKEPTDDDHHFDYVLLGEATKEIDKIDNIITSVI